jgi:hypothetical protein
MADTKTIVSGVFITLTLLLSGAYIMVDKEHTYYCTSLDSVGYCDKLSSGIGTRCYYNSSLNYKTCSEGWKPISGFLNITEENNTIPQSLNTLKVNANMRTWTCQITDGFITSYTKCKSDSNTEGYIGELI